MFKNEPYVKKYENGCLINPITKHKPYFQLASQKDGKKLRKSNNRKGFGLVVAKVGPLSFCKYRIVKQQGRKSQITHAILTNN